MNWSTIKTFFENCDYVIGAATILGTLLGAISIIWNPVVESVSNYPRYFLLGSVGMYFILTGYIQFLINKNRQNKDLQEQLPINKNRQNKDLPEHSRWKHSVLIVDDDDVFLSKVEEYLSEKMDASKLDLVSVNRIVDYRLAEDFEIVIGDLVGTGSGAKQSIAILNAIKSLYPYKVVVAMSKTPSLGSDLKIDGKVLNKSQKKQIFADIKKTIEDAGQKLDCAASHWKSVSAELESQHVPKEDIDKKKENYCHFVARKQS